MIIFLDNTERDLVQGALYNHFINLNSTIMYKYLDGNILAIDVRRFNWSKDSIDFCLDKFKQDFKSVILHIDHKNNLE